MTFTIWLPVIGAFLSGVAGVFITNWWSDRRSVREQRLEALRAINGYILALDRLSDYLWARGEGHAGNEDFPAYRPDRYLLTPGSRVEVAEARREAEPYLHMLRFSDDDDRRKALSPTMPDSGKGHPIPDAEVCDERIELLRASVNRGIELKAKLR